MAPLSRPALISCSRPGSLQQKRPQTRKLCTVEMGVHAWQAWRASWCAAAMGVAGRWERRGSISSIAIAMVLYSHRAWHAHRRGLTLTLTINQDGKVLGSDA
uniref:Uncharacterized protein n=1 Tax=Haptolina brevifila TaxID=156173 RepID=A0A7S2CFZ3_9EUKA|mmetsp:Transcript_24277/g.48593  ORF Transcript_24277/g.48593 Transcript_24277/m.48593 type:complete len:102 (+) Transcript_24277:444-749(+)